MRPSYTVQLDKPHQLRYGTNAIAALEATLGRPITSLVAEREVDGQKVQDIHFGILELRAMLWAGLIWERKQEGQPPYTLDQVGDMLDDAPDYAAACAEVGKAVGDALRAPGNGAGEQGNVPAASR